MQSIPWLRASSPMPEAFSALVSQFQPKLAAASNPATQLLWQRHIRAPEQLAAFWAAQPYQPPVVASEVFDLEMSKAVARLQQASAEKVAVWGTADLAGIVSTALLWQGLSRLFAAPATAPTYWIPHRSPPAAGLEALVAAGCSLIVTCGRGAWVEQAKAAGLEVIWIDRAWRAWPRADLSDRPPVAAWLNSRGLPVTHPLANLPSVAVAYHLIKALSQALGTGEAAANLLDLVAVGLLADPLPLTGESRYLAQQGTVWLQRHQDPINPPRPGLTRLLQLCRITGDRPTDLAVGLGPRLQAISRLWDEPERCVELLVSQDLDRGAQLAEQAELANARRKVLQRQTVAQAKAKLIQLDLSTARVIVLSDPQWAIAILALAAEELAQTYGRPVILLGLGADSMASGAARAGGLEQTSGSGPAEPVDLRRLLPPQVASWLSEIWGEGAAVELSLPSENIERFTEAINQQARAMGLQVELPQADLVVTVAELGKALFQQLRLLEPYGIGNPVPRLLIREGWFTQVWHRKIRDLSGQKLDYIKTEFELRDETVMQLPQGFPGVWWGHYKDELPVGRCDVIVELDFSSYTDAQRQQRYELRLIAVRPSQPSPAPQLIQVLDWRQGAPDSAQIPAQIPAQANEPLILRHCPTSWAELKGWVQQAQQAGKPLALAYDLPVFQPPAMLWQALLERVQLSAKLGEAISLDSFPVSLQLSEPTLAAGLAALQDAALQDAAIHSPAVSEPFMQAVAQAQFMQRYFWQVPLATVLTTLQTELQAGQTAA